jgi:hypothetical protein
LGAVDAQIRSLDWPMLGVSDLRGSIICIRALIARREPDHWAVHAEPLGQMVIA